MDDFLDFLYKVMQNIEAIIAFVIFMEERYPNTT